MKMKFFTALTLVFATVAAAFASDYKDGIDYFNAGQIENAKTILERTINDATTNKAEAFYYLGEIAFVNKITKKQPSIMQRVWLLTPKTVSTSLVKVNSNL